MKHFLKLRGSIRTIVVAAAVAVVFGSSFAVASSLIISKNIKNGTIKPVDLNKKLQKKINQRTTAAAGIPGQQGATGPAGPKGQEGPKGSSGISSYGSPHWGALNRNTENSAVAELRAGPYGGVFGGTLEAPPLGEGSLELNVMSATSKVDFGNEIDYEGQPVSGLTKVGFSVFTTGENNGRGINMPGIRFEINPKKAGGTTTTYSSLVFTPTANSTAGKWTHINAVTEGLWGLTGGQFNEAATMNERCGLNGARCTFAQVKTFLATGEGATIYTAAVGKGKDFPFEGDVDALEINSQTVNFEPNGVTVTE